MGHNHYVTGMILFNIVASNNGFKYYWANIYKI